jgi:hypothetical protein
MRDRAETLFFNVEEDRFELQMALNCEIYYFNRKNWLYVYENTSKRHSILTTVEEKKTKYKNREVIDAEKARELLRKMAWPSLIINSTDQQWIYIKLSGNSLRRASCTRYLEAWSGVTQVENDYSSGKCRQIWAY